MAKLIFISLHLVLIIINAENGCFWLIFVETWFDELNFQRIELYNILN